MSKKLVALVLLLIVALMSGGCPFLTSAAHTRAHKRVVNQDMREIHQCIDRHFWNYDWEDPYAN